MDSATLPPVTAEDIKEGEFAEGFELMYSDADPSWRHGCYMSQVFKREADNTFWKVHYRRSADGETNELSEGMATVLQVFQHTETVTVYKETEASTSQQPDANPTIECTDQPEIERLRGFLQKISEGKGAFSMDPLEHAGNCIDAMKALAVAALAGEPIEDHED